MDKLESVNDNALETVSVKKEDLITSKTSNKSEIAEVVFVGVFLAVALSLINAVENAQVANIEKRAVKKYIQDLKLPTENLTPTTVPHPTPKRPVQVTAEQRPVQKATSVTLG